jgi:branched-chain amino acid transport system substrate-binding protein
VSAPRVYASLPLTGRSRSAGREVLRGAELAFEQRGAEDMLVVLDSGGDDREHRAIANATRAAADLDAVAYLGDFHSSQVRHTAPILAEAGLLGVAPVATFAGLEGRTLVRIMPHDGVGARAIAEWLRDHAVERLLVVHDHDEGYGEPVGRMCADAAGALGIDVRSRPVWNHDEPPADDLGDAQAVLYVGVAGSGAAQMWSDLHDTDPALWLLGSEGVADGRLAAAMPDGAAERTRFFVAPRAPLAFYGFEAAALILDSIAAGSGRAPAVQAARTTRDRNSIIGRYSIDADGHTTSPGYGRLRVDQGELVWDRRPVC